MSFAIQLDLFDKVVLPVLLYSCEIWSYENIDVIKCVHLWILKHILNLKSSIPIFMIYGETDRFPLYITIHTRMIGFGAKMILCQENKLCKTMYMYLYSCYIRDEINIKWLICIKNILDSCGLSFYGTSKILLTSNG